MILQDSSQERLGQLAGDTTFREELVQAWVEFVRQPVVRRRAVFLEDYDIALAQERLGEHWSDLRFGSLEVSHEGSRLSFAVQVYLGEVAPHWVRVEVYAEPAGDGAPLCQAMDRGEQIPGAIEGYVYRATVPASRPPAHFTPRVIPAHPAAGVPLEEHRILWYR